MTPCVLLIWLLLGVILPAGLWVSVGATMVLVVVAHKRSWSVAKFSIWAVSLLVGVTLANIIFGG